MKNRRTEIRDELGLQREKEGSLEWFYRFMALPLPDESISLKERELIHRSRINSIILLLGFVPTLMVFPLAMSTENGVLRMILFGVCLVHLGALLFNKIGKIVWAGLFCVIATEIGLLSAVLSNTSGSLASTWYLLNMFVQPEIFAVSLLPAGSVFIVMLINCLLFTVLFIVLPHGLDPNIFYISLLQPIILQIVVATSTYLWIRGANRVIKHADNVEEIAYYQHEALKLQEQATLQKYQLEHSIASFEQVHDQIANGNLSARVSLEDATILLSIAGKLNMLLARFQRLAVAEMEHQQLEKAIHQRAIAIQEAIQSGKSLPLEATGTTLDELLLAIQISRVQSEQELTRQ